MFEWLFNGKKLRENGVLGMNDRNYSVIAKYNRRSLYTLVDDKVKTKGWQTALISIRRK